MLYFVSSYVNFSIYKCTGKTSSNRYENCYALENITQLAHRTQAVIYALKKGIISLDEIDLP